jgi:RNA polymerase sigma factor (sigma-70 family)
MSAEDRISPEALLAHAGWVRDLARGLLRDPHSADDVVQETWLAALRRAPEDSSRLASWLARVARNFAGKRIRGDARRAGHERLAPEREPAPSPADLFERAALHREIVEAVLALDEPYRAAILLRYFEELTPRAIARRDGMPVRTVKTRLARGLEKLRSQLDARAGGNREAWLGALVAFTREPFAVGPAATAATLMSTNLKLWTVGSVLAAILAAIFVLDRRSASVSGPSRTARSVLSPTSLAGAPAAPSALEAAQAEPPRSTEAQDGAAKPAADSGATSGTVPELRGKVTDSSGRPLRGVRIDVRQFEGRGFELLSARPELAVESLAASITSDERGEFRVRLPPARPFDLCASLAGYADRRLPGRFAGEDVTVVLTAGVTIFGRVTRTTDSAPCAGASIRAGPGMIRMDGEPQFVAQTDESGAYRLEGLPPGELSLAVDSSGEIGSFGVVVVASEGAAIERNFALVPGVLATGVVTDAATGLPIAGAEVDSGKRASLGIARTDADGRYALRGIECGSGRIASLRASAPGFAVLHRQVEATPSEPLRVDFELRAGRSASGRVIGPDDRPIVGALVMACGTGGSQNAKFYDEKAVRTDADGRFRLADLAGGAHHMLFLRKEGCGTKVFDFPSAEESRDAVDFGDLRLPEPATVLGRVVDETGSPIPDAFVAIAGSNSDALRFSDRETGYLFDRGLRRSARSDRAGRFSFTDLAPGSYTLTATAMKGSATTARGEIRIDEGETQEDLVLALTVGEVLEGKVLGPDGRPVTGMSVFAVREVETEAGVVMRSASDVSRGDGSFHLQGLEAAAYTVIVEPFIAPEENGALDLASARWGGVRAGERHLALVLPAAAWIEGIVLDPEGAPVGDAQVQADTEEDGPDGVYWPTAIGRTDAAGRFRVKVGAASRVNLSAFAGMRTNSGGLHMEFLARMSGVAAGTTDVRLQLEAWH